MRFIRESLQDGKGEYSWTRMSASISLAMALFLTVFQVFTGTDQYTLITTWLGFAYGGKITQKFAEGMDPKSSPSPSK